MSYPITYLKPKPPLQKIAKKRRVSYSSRYENYKTFCRLISKLQQAGGMDYLEEVMKLNSWNQRFRFAQRLRYQRRSYGNYNRS